MIANREGLKAGYFVGHNRGRELMMEQLTGLSPSDLSKIDAGAWKMDEDLNV